MVRVVIDTNVMVSALIAPGKPRHLVTRLMEHHRVVSSAEMLEELIDGIPVMKKVRSRVRRSTGSYRST